MDSALTRLTEALGDGWTITVSTDEAIDLNRFGSEIKELDKALAEAQAAAAGKKPALLWKKRRAWFVFAKKTDCPNRPLPEFALVWNGWVGITLDRFLAWFTGAEFQVMRPEQN